MNQVIEQYVQRLPLPPSQRHAAIEHVRAEAEAKPEAAPCAQTSGALASLHAAIAAVEDAPRDPAHAGNAYASVAARLRLATDADCDAEGARPQVLRDRVGGVRVQSTPPLNRSSMAPRRWQGRTGAPPRQADRPSWELVGTVRRTGLALVIALQTWFATQFMVSVLPYHGTKLLEVAVLVLFAILFSWVSAGFWMAIMGFVLLLRGRDRHAISASAAPDAPIDKSARTALVMPICNEDVPRVFAGLRATYESLGRAGALEHFDFFVLSDSSDADARVAELDAWMRMCRELKAFGRVFYRWRQHRIKRKSGNIADFCRRWGRNYRYMVILDADSVMTGQCLTTLVRLMEANPDAGIIQTAPRAAGHNSLFARVQQFANRVYGPSFVAGLHYFELGESHYWGHNAIIRVAPFIEHCALARLPGRGSLSGEILSHDFVEAALMRRAGWGVWIAYDLPGSYEEMPPNLVDELKRDRRWCQGNLINLRLSWARGLHPAHRAVFVIGVMAYVSAPLWFLFLILSTALLAVHTLVEPQYFVQPAQLFPLWPEWHPNRGISLYVATATLLFLPKILGVVLVLLQGAREYGGALRLALGMLAEMVFSALLAPVRMLFHTQFVVRALTGWSVQWKSPPREDTQTTWGDALRHHGLHTLLGIGWAALVYWLNPAFLWWLLPVVGALILSIPLSVYSSRAGLGRWFRRRRFFLIPEESHPPEALRRVYQQVRSAPPTPGFVDAVVDPLVNAVACAAGVTRLRPSASEESRTALVARALAAGPQSVSTRDRHALLREPVALSELHVAVWTTPDAHPGWQAALSAPASPPRTAATLAHEPERIDNLAALPAALHSAAQP
jgi:membrane glycosyltransferase